MLFWGDRILISCMDQLDLGDIKLVATRRTGIGTNLAGHAHCALEGQLVREGKRLGSHGRLEHDTLEYTAAVTQAHKDQAALLGTMGDPAGESHRAAGMCGDRRNRRRRQERHTFPNSLAIRRQCSMQAHLSLAHQGCSLVAAHQPARCNHHAPMLIVHDPAARRTCNVITPAAPAWQPSQNLSHRSARLAHPGQRSCHRGW